MVDDLTLCDEGDCATSLGALVSLDLRNNRLRSVRDSLDEIKSLKEVWLSGM